MWSFVMRMPFLIVALAGLAIGSIAAWSLRAPENKGSERLTSEGKALIGGPFSLVDHTGRAVTDKDFHGRKLLMFFGYTSCPDICPSGLQVMAAALDKLGSKADTVTPVFVSVDPERDTPEKLAAYVASFHPRLVGLTGTPEAVNAAAKVFRIYHRKVPDPNTPGGYGMDHSSVFYLMDEQGVFVRHFPHTNDADALAAELAKSL
jgi:protein SCO1/2